MPKRAASEKFRIIKPLLATQAELKSTTSYDQGRIAADSISSLGLCAGRICIQRRSFCGSYSEPANACGEKTVGTLNNGTAKPVLFLSLGLFRGFSA
jgi:hypothetical protein